MIFRSETRKIELKNKDKSLEEICETMNSANNSNLKCYPSISMTPSIYVTKKYFSDFFPFNFAHLASLMIEAKAEYIDRSENQLVFSIGLNNLYSFTSIFGLLFLSVIALYFLINLELIFGICILGFTII